MRILLALDHSAYSKTALAGLLAQMPPAGNEVRVIHVVDVVQIYFAEGMMPILTRQTAAIAKERREQGKSLVDSAVRTLRKAGFRTSLRLASGDPKEQILKCADAWPADLIVLGSHGLTGYTRLLMGSVSEAVMRHARCSVEIVRGKAIDRRRKSNPSPPARK